LKEVERIGPADDNYLCRQHGFGKLSCRTYQALSLRHAGEM